jgi:polyribonucleotide nucleotidyltransferase
MAQDFNKAFGIGHNSPETYNLTDAIGVALRAIQELAEIVDDLKTENKELRAALNLPEKEKRKKKEIERELNDEEKEILHIAEKRARKAILKRILEAENAK